MVKRLIVFTFVGMLSLASFVGAEKLFAPCINVTTGERHWSHDWIEGPEGWFYKPHGGRNHQRVELVRKAKCSDCKKIAFRTIHTMWQIEDWVKE